MQHSDNLDNAVFGDFIKNQMLATSMPVKSGLYRGVFAVGMVFLFGNYGKFINQTLIINISLMFRPFVDCIVSNRLQIKHSLV